MGSSIRDFFVFKYACRGNNTVFLEGYHSLENAGGYIIRSCMQKFEILGGTLINGDDKFRDDSFLCTIFCPRWPQKGASVSYVLF